MGEDLPKAPADIVLTWTVCLCVRHSPQSPRQTDNSMADPHKKLPYGHILLFMHRYNIMT